MELRLERVSHAYPTGVRALDKVDLRIGAGETVALVGANGSGKTTLLSHLVGLLRPSEGRVLVDGRDARGHTVAQLAAHTGLCFADPGDQVFSRSVAAEVAFGPRNLGLDAGATERAVRRALQATGLAAVASAHPDDLGPSKRKLLAIASVLAMETPVVALDEPTASLDAQGTATVRAIVNDLAAAGRTVVVASHDIDFVAESFRRVVVLRDGRIVLEATPAEVFAEARWEVLREAGIEPPAAARLGAELGLGSTPTDEQLLEALRRRAQRSRPRRGDPRRADLTSR